MDRNALCAPACREPRDEHGNAPPPPIRQTFDWYGGAPDQLLPMLMRSAFSLALAVKRMRRRRQLRAYRESAGPVVPIARARDGLVAIEGTVEVLEPIGGAPRDVAAFIRREVTSGPAGKSEFTTLESVTVRRGAGRFIVRDLEGVALIDDDWLEIHTAEGISPGPEVEGELMIRQGDRVQVVGPAKRGGVDVPAAPAGSYRGPPAAIRFDGRPGRPVCLFLT